MNIKQRINARKIMLSYIYQHCFFYNLVHEEAAIVESLFIDYVFKTDNEKYDQAKEEFVKTIYDYLDKTSEETLNDFTEEFFDEWQKEDIDFDYIFKIGQTFKKYKDKIIEKVNNLTESFKYEQMDTIDQALFILGYTERKELKTPKEVLLNELIELAKRYSDEGSPKLLNGIMHKIVNS